MDVSYREDLLKKAISERRSMLVAFSGGVDSGLLAFFAHTLLKEKSRAVLLDSPVVPRDAVRNAREVAESLGLLFEIIPFPLMDSVLFTKNPKERCYHCRKISSRILKQRAEELGISCVADGLNISDTSEHRPGIRASNEEGIVHPFIEAGITKENIRAIARRNNLVFWNRPSDACLSSRVPYGDEITLKKLAMIEDGEEYLSRLGVGRSRVRVHSTVARIEADTDGMAIIYSHKDEVVTTFRKIGFTHVALELGGYRSGSLDEIA